MQLAVTGPEQRHRIYEGVRALVYPGFLLHHVAVSGTRLVLRSLSDDDWFILRTRTWGTTPRDWSAWLVASATWMVDGQVVLGDDEAIYRLYEMCRQIPVTVLDDLNAIVTALMNQVHEATERVEAFIYEAESRLLWTAERNRVAEGRSLHGVCLGTNPVRRVWTYFNNLEDEREANDYEWAIAKFLVGPHAPKGVKKIAAQDSKRDADRRRQRQATMDRVYYEATGVLKPKRDGAPRAKKRAFQEFRQAESPEEMREEMRRWVLGIKDDHDLVVESVKDKIRNDVERRRAEAIDSQRALQRALDEEGVPRSQMVPLSGDAGRELIARLRDRLPGSRVLLDNTHNRAYDKYIKSRPSSGTLKVDDAGHISPDVSADPEMLRMLVRPDEDRRTLQENIERRRPTASFDGDGGEE